MSHVAPIVQATNALQHLCLHRLLADRAEQTPEAPVILAPGRAPLTYNRVRSCVDDVVQTLRAMGVDRHDRVALVLPNGPEMAVACLAIASGATCVPLNPAYSRNEFDFFLAGVHAKALIVQEGIDSPARAAAHARGICIIELSPVFEAEAGCFVLTSKAQTRAAPSELAQPDDVALVLHTTGTTSWPKLVPLTHTNICASAYNIRSALELVASDCCLNVMPLFHGHGLKGTVLPSLVAGASVVCAPGFDASTFFAWMEEFRPTWYTAVPTIHQAVLAHAALHHETITSCPLRFIRSGAAPLSPRVLTELEKVFNAPVIETYALTETCTVTCNPPPQRQRKTGSVGVTVGSEVAIMDERGALLPAGEAGEVVVRGASVMQGYENDPAANCSAFTQGWFRTGDEGYLDAEGYLFITGRIKEIINRGGEKIAPQAVDDVLMEHPAVAQAVTFAVPHTRLGEDVAAAVVLHQHATATHSDIRQFAATRLAAFKVPRQVLIVKDIPKGPTGKLQRHRLAEQLGLVVPESVRPTMPSGFTAPRTPVEELLVGLWSQVLKLERVGIHDDFFALGGDSLLAMQLISRIRATTHVEVPFVSFFETPTVAGMARSIETAGQTAWSQLAQPLQFVSRDGTLPLSYAQQRLWFLDQLGLSRHAYHLLEGIRLRGTLKVAALAQSLQEITRRHEVLRTTFINIGGQPIQVIGPVASSSLRIVELRGLPECEQEAQVRELTRAEVERPFDLTQGPLVRATLACLDDEEHALLLTMHHIISDGWSHGIFWRELALLYDAFASGKPSPLPALSIQYADFAHWQQQWLQGEVLDAHLAYWIQQLTGVSMLQIPTDRPRPAVQTFRGARQPWRLSPPLTQALKALSQRRGVTLFMTLLAAFQALLHRYTGQDDIAVGSLIANRNRVEIEGLIGFFVNTLVLRSDLSGDPSFQALLERMREVALEAYSHQDLPYEKLLEKLRLPRDLSHHPLFQVMFVLHNTPRQASGFASLTLSALEVDPGTARFDVTLDLWETPEGLHGLFEYNTDLFEAATIARMGGHLQTLLQGIVAHPEQRLSTLPLLTADERHRLLVEWNATRMDRSSDKCIHQMFEAQEAQTPDAVAITCENEALTYRELNRRANQVAHHLRALGVGSEMLVGLCMERSLEMVVALLGILKAGAAYMPLDPAYPPERLAFMLEDAQVPVVVTQERCVAGLPYHRAEVVCLDAQWHSIARHSDQNPVSGATAGNLAYVLYTSGSTGRPKGVLGTHCATLNVLCWLWQAYPFVNHEVCCQKTSMNFVDSIQELLGPLLHGVRTILIPDAVLHDPPRLVHTLAGHHVTRILLVPSSLRVLLDTHVDLESRLSSLRLWFVGGESLSKELCQRFVESMPHSRLVNLYGTSEVSADATWYDTSLIGHDLLHVPIGRPLANTQIYLLDRHLQPVPVGVPGELHVGGAGLARGYLNRPKLTAERFIPNPFGDEPDARLYKTGDLARYLPAGTIECLGRLDHQVKVRGVRIELGEIEAALERHPVVREAAVVAREDVPGETRLVAYVVPAQAPGPTSGELRRLLTKMLPDAMIPTACVTLAALPLTPSGKVERRALPVPDLTSVNLEELFVAPRTPIEQQVAAIWCHLLGLEQIGIHDNFFELGGHSLLAMQCVARLQVVFQVDLSVRSLFDTPTIAGLAMHLETVLWATSSRQASLSTTADDREEGEL